MIKFFRKKKNEWKIHIFLVNINNKNNIHHQNHLKQHIVLMMVFQLFYTFIQSSNYICVLYTIVWCSGLVQFFFLFDGIPVLYPVISHDVVVVFTIAIFLITISITHTLYVSSVATGNESRYIICCFAALLSRCAIGEVIDVLLLFVVLLFICKALL